MGKVPIVVIKYSTLLKEVGHAAVAGQKPGKRKTHSEGVKH